MFRFLSDLNFKLPFLYELSRRNLWILYSIVVPFAFPLFSNENRCRAKINERNEWGEKKRRLRRISKIKNFLRYRDEEKDGI